MSSNSPRGNYALRTFTRIPISWDFPKEADSKIPKVTAGQEAGTKLIAAWAGIAI